MRLIWLVSYTSGVAFENVVFDVSHHPRRIILSNGLDPSLT